MLTAKGFELTPRESTEKYGIAKLMVKPFSPRELLRTVEELLAAQAEGQDNQSAAHAETGARRS